MDYYLYRKAETKPRSRLQLFWHAFKVEHFCQNMRKLALFGHVFVRHFQDKGQISPKFRGKLAKYVGQLMVKFAILGLAHTLWAMPEH